MMLARLGLHELQVRIARSKRIPCLAKPSMFGVRTERLPYAPQSSQPMSSAIIITKLGRELCAANRETSAKRQYASTYPILEITNPILCRKETVCRAVAVDRKPFVCPLEIPCIDAVPHVMRADGWNAPLLQRGYALQMGHYANRKALLSGAPHNDARFVRRPRWSRPPLATNANTSHRRGPVRRRCALYI